MTPAPPCPATDEIDAMQTIERPIPPRPGATPKRGRAAGLVALAALLLAAAGDVLATLTQGGRHQRLLDAGIGQVLALLQQQASLDFIAAHVVDWLRKDHPWKEKLLPSEWIGEHTAELVARSVQRLLHDLEADSRHPLRQGFDEAVARFIERLRHDDAFIAQERKSWAQIVKAAGLSLE